MYRKMTRRSELEALGLNIHRFYCINDETGDIQEFYLCNDRNDYIERDKEEAYD